MIHKDHFLTLLTDNTNVLLNTTYKNGREILKDKNPDVLMEILNMLFRDINDLKENDVVNRIFDVDLEEDYTYHYKSQKSKSVQLEGTKKQTHTLKLLESMIVNIVDRLFSIDDLLTDKAMRKKIESGIVDRYYAVIAFIESRDQYHIIWDQPLFDGIKLEILEDIKRLQHKPSGVKGMGVCRKCGSEELRIYTKQTRGGDEGQTSEYICVACSFKWVVK